MRTIWLACLVVALGLSGCSSFVKAPEGEAVSYDAAQAAWKKVLAENVDKEGRVNFRNVGAHPQDLEKFVRFIGQAKRDQFKNKDEKLAFELNAYNALSMYNVIQKGYPLDLDGTFKRAKFFYFTEFPIYGEEQDLFHFEKEIRQAGDPRVHVALNCMSTGCPRLPREPFTGAALQAQLDREAHKFYNEERNVRVDLPNKKVHISQILEFFTDDFLAKSPTLVDYVNQYRKEKVPAGLEVKFIPYNWTIYRQPEKETK